VTYPGKWLRSLVCAFLVIALSGAYANDDDDDRDRRHHGSSQFSIEVLSGRPDTIAGGDALIRVTVKKKNVRLSDVRIELNGADITGSFVADQSARTLTGLVTGMRLGRNELEVDTKGKGRGRADAELRLTNYPIEGPVFSGPHETPFICATAQFNLPVIGGNLGAPLDANCSIANRVDYFYRTTAGAFAPWPAGATAYPANLAMTTTTIGKTVPYIVRMMTGTANRAIYQNTVLHDPLSEAAPSWRNPPKNWNGRLVYTFGGGCIGGWYRQGSGTGGVSDDFRLRNGYAMASSSLNVFGNNCNDLLAAESMMMTKERFIEAYGPPAHTQGWGCSGGSYAQHQIADNYPGLLDGIIPCRSFPDVGFATINFITDAWLLDTYFNRADIAAWTPEQKRLVTGFMVYNSAPEVAINARRIDPDANCGTLPVELRYNAVTNPLGARCDVYDHTVNVYGRDPATGFARRPLDNVGIQYGLKLVNGGAISVEQFLDLNEKIGGFDIDANLVPRRTVADLAAARAAYRTGRLTSGGGGLSELPIIDYRGYNDRLAGGDVHLRYHSFSMRERLDKANGRHDNQIIVLEDNGLSENASPLARRMLLAMDRWISAIKADKRHGKQIDKVVRNKPADLLEGCNSRDLNNPTFIAETQVREQERVTTCNTLYPTNSFPREVAGADIAADIIKCHRKSLRHSDYAVAFTPAQWTRLQAVFPQGVCDWSKRGYEQQDLQDTWIFFD